MNADHHTKMIFPSMVFIILICFIASICLSLSHKKPSFCDQSSESFSFLWTIKRDPPCYLFGTIHVPYTKVWSFIPDNAKQAFYASSQVYFELDLVNPTTVSALSSCQMLPQGKNLSDVLPDDLYSRLKRHLEYVRGMMPHWMTADQKGRGLYADYLFNAIAGNWERKRPVWVMLMVNSLTESDVRSRGVPVLDLFLAQEAERMKKKTSAVEKVEEQCLPLNSLNFTQVLFALNHTLLQHELRENEPSYTTDDLIHHYNCGELNAGQDTLPTLSGNLSSEEAVLAHNIDAYFKQELIYNRNMRMGKRVAHLMRHNPEQSLFFALGAGHFLGNNTVLDFVQAQGFEIEHMSVNSKIPKCKSKKSVRSNLEKVKEPTPPTRRGTGKRSSRHRPLNSLQKTGSAFGMRLHFDSDSATTPHTPRLFNELWVRLDPSSKKKSSDSSLSLSEHPVTPQQAFQTWFQRGHILSRSPPSSHIHSSFTSIIGLFFFFIIRLILSSSQELTGVT